MTYPTNRPWIALMGDAGAGKDAVAQVLMTHYGYHRVAFADPVRQALLALDPLIPTKTGPPWRLSDYVRMYGWEACKRNNPEVRALLQRMGTDAIRALDENFWADLGEWNGDRLEADGLVPVFTDTRFPNEVAMVRSSGGVLVLVERPGHDNTAAGHVSEAAWRTETPDYTLTNNSTLDALEHQVRFTMDMAILEDAANA